MTAIKHDDYIQTYTGKKFYLVNPTEDMICIEDIAHALSMQCRFTGHIKRFYSVAEHSTHVASLCYEPNELAGLLHDASEAYITDIASPFKPFLTNYKEFEHGIMLVMSKKFNFEYPFNKDVHDCDILQLKTEAISLLNHRPDWAFEDRYATIKQHGIPPRCYSPEIAERAFLDTYELIKGVY